MKNILLSILLLLPILQIYAETKQENETSRTVKLVVSGEGMTKDEATKFALRSAIEQAFGAFVSSNTDILNDDIIKDEIATVSSGNIQSYKELSTIDLGKTKVVNIEAVVSIGKLVSFAKSKGMKTELAGATFAMNMKMRELNKKNELIALENLYKQLMILAKETHLFDYKLFTSEPYQAENGMYGIDVTIKTISNKNAITFYDIYEKTLKSLAVSPREALDLVKAKIEIFPYAVGFKAYNYQGDYKDCEYQDMFLRNNLSPSRNTPWGGATKREFRKIFDMVFLSSLFRFKIIDNIGNEFTIGKKEILRPKVTTNDWNSKMSVAIAGKYDMMDISEVEKHIIYFIACNLKKGEFYAPNERKKLGEYTFGGYANDDISKIKTWNKSFTISITYSPEEFMNLSSLEIKPIPKLPIID